MESKDKFQEMLRDILEIARVQGNQLGMNEIKSLFGDMNLNEAQYEHIFAYLAANHITIKGYVASENEYSRALQKEEKQAENDYEQEEYQEEETGKDVLKKQEPGTHEEDSAYLKMYLEDLRGIKELTPEEESSLMNQIIKGDDFAKSRYIEANLHYVVKVAAEYKNQGVSMEDLIQEGNMGLISSLDSMTGISDSKQGKELVAGIIRRFMEAAIEDQKESSSFEDNIVKKINYIRDAANELAEDLCREANIHELAAYIKMPEEEIAEILNMAVDGIKLENNHKESSITDKHSGDPKHSHNPTHTRLYRSPRIR